MKKLIFVLLLSSVFLTTSTNLALADTAKSKMSQKHMTQVDLNTATLEQLVTLPGVGKKRQRPLSNIGQKMVSLNL